MNEIEALNIIKSSQVKLAVPVEKVFSALNLTLEKIKNTDDLVEKVNYSAEATIMLQSILSVHPELEPFFNTDERPLYKTLIDKKLAVYSQTE